MNPRPVNRRPNRAFTLIELLLVLVILAVLAAVVVPKFTSRTKEARIAAAKTDISNLDTALDAYEIDTGSYPNSQQGLDALVNQPAGVTNWKGPYVKKGIPKDPWGNDYIYACPGTHNTSGYDLSSNGPPDSNGDLGIDNWTVNSGSSK